VIRAGTRPIAGTQSLVTSGYQKRRNRR
jgi:hypothetical protein